MTVALQELAVSRGVEPRPIALRQELAEDLAGLADLVAMFVEQGLVEQRHLGDQMVVAGGWIGERCLPVAGRRRRPGQQQLGGGLVLRGKRRGAEQGLGLAPVVFGQGLDRARQPAQLLLAGRALAGAGRQLGGAGNVARHQGGDEGVQLDRVGIAVLSRGLGEEAGRIVALALVQRRLAGEKEAVGRGLVIGPRASAGSLARMPVGGRHGGRAGAKGGQRQKDGEATNSRHGSTLGSELWRRQGSARSGAYMFG